MTARETTPEVPSEVRAAARRGEPDRYLAATLAAPSARPALVAIAAFSAELARIPASVSEDMLGQIKLQWWRDALAQGQRGTLSGHPVADAVVAAALRHTLSPELLTAMIDAREQDLAGEMPPDQAGFEAYLEATEGAAFRLALAVLGARRAEDRSLATLAGLAYGTARVLARLPLLLRGNGFPLPADRLWAAGFDAKQWPALSKTGQDADTGREAEAARRLREGLQAGAQAAHAKVRARCRSLPRTVRPALLPLVMVEPYFRAQSGRSHLATAPDASPLGRVLRIGTAHLTGRI